MYAALFPDGPLRNLALLAAPVGFATEEARGLFKPLTSERFFDPDPVIEAFGNVPATDLFGAGRRLPGAASDRPEVEPAHLAREAFTDSFLAASEWVDDGVPFPGEAFRSWVLDFYRHDRLARGELELRGLRVELSNVRVPLLSVAGGGCDLPPAPGPGRDEPRREPGQGVSGAGRRARGPYGRPGSKEEALAKPRRLASPALGVDPGADGRERETEE
jgi:hypothetical protein